MVANHRSEDGRSTTKDMDEQLGKSCFYKTGSGKKAISDLSKYTISNLTYSKKEDFVKYSEKLVDHLADLGILHLIDEKTKRKIVTRSELLEICREMKETVNFSEQETNEIVNELEQEIRRTVRGFVRGEKPSTKSQREPTSTFGKYKGFPNLNRQ